MLVFTENCIVKIGVVFTISPLSYTVYYTCAHMIQYLRSCCLSLPQWVWCKMSVYVCYVHYGTCHTFQSIYSLIVAFYRTRSTATIELHQLLTVMPQVVAVFQMLKQVSCSAPLGPVNTVSQSRKHGACVS